MKPASGHSEERDDCPKNDFVEAHEDDHHEHEIIDPHKVLPGTECCKGFAEDGRKGQDLRPL